jgi:phosphosulfolactate synthase
VSALYPPALLRAKVALIRSYGVNVYPGGTFFEVAVTQNKIDEYLRRCKDIEFNYMEMSDG